MPNFTTRISKIVKKFLHGQKLTILILINIMKYNISVYRDNDITEKRTQRKGLSNITYIV